MYKLATPFTTLHLLSYDQPNNVHFLSAHSVPGYCIIKTGKNTQPVQINNPSLEITNINVAN